jgi:hypothetical protein
MSKYRFWIGMETYIKLFFTFGWTGMLFLSVMQAIGLSRMLFLPFRIEPGFLAGVLIKAVIVIFLAFYVVAIPRLIMVYKNIWEVEL